MVFWAENESLAVAGLKDRKKRIINTLLKWAIFDAIPITIQLKLGFLKAARNEVV